MKKWIQGYACAIANLVRMHGGNTGEREALEACGLTSMAELKRYEIDAYDVEVLAPLVKEIEDREIRMNKKKNG